MKIRDFLRAGAVSCALFPLVVQAQQANSTVEVPAAKVAEASSQGFFKQQRAQNATLRTGSAMDYYLSLRGKQSGWQGLTLGGQAADAQDDKAAATPFKPTLSVGALMHIAGVGIQDPTSTDPTADVTQNWQRQLFNYRTRLLFGGQISPRTSWFIETEVPTVDGIGWGQPDGTRNIQVPFIILDAQVEHVFAKQFSLIAGMQLVGINRNQLQGAASLMGVDFGYYQYQYTLTENSALQNNYGRDIGVNARGFFLDERLEYRLGVFGGKNWDNYGPMRTIARLNYNFLDKETGQYYTGNSLGESKLLALGGGADLQGGYSAFGADLFVDYPVSEGLSVLANTSFSVLNGGDPRNPYNLGMEIPTQSILFAEAAIYHKKSKLSPFFILEMINMSGDYAQLGLTEDAPASAIDDANQLRSISRMGGGLCYYFNGYNANIKIQYVQNGFNGVNPSNGDVVGQTNGTIWAQLQLFVF